MTAPAGAVFGTIGALAAFPLRLAAREVERQHGQLRRGVTRRTTHVVCGRTLLAKAGLSRNGDAEIERRVAAERAAGHKLLSENGFLRLLGLMKAPEASSLSRQSLIEQSRLSGAELDLLSLFDAFEHDAEPYSFRDLILARKYAGLVAGGATWGAIARSVHRSGPVASLTAKSLNVGSQHGRADAIYLEGGQSELDGQLLFDLGSAGSAGDDTLEELFAEAEAAEEGGDHDRAAALYQRCLAIDPSDAIAAFNRANCLRAGGHAADAAHDYINAIKLDPAFVEAWFNLAGLMSEQGREASARRHLQKAIALDKNYADPVFNLARLEFDAGDLPEARRLWVRYLELDAESEWSRMAAKGVQFVDLQLARTAG
ncbi:tetratricopeptide repeat protein [Mesorhizobium ciceri]|uniref:tetratricopeptide repeat protein n=1 Tax=Mesorhizobium TaxID=68287 RepID=UPI0007A95265|nr:MULTISPECIES: tetratricopeptide repeat protein [Mesorhizobium]AMX94063.1 O-linked GlcNAc transferase [Mesorhizobium ciceri]AMY01430.1 O-linked GlcNAc transferase [Mesorhizobium ciceri biovar biserrulae]MDF3208810.1 tetratricopeptide repeat protein [Mesorhizobium sp. LMG15046]MDF3228618.1 tetratricopeptide repeat protein [Mesorhizobium sp. DSM 30133]RUU20196.1 tetratricopeptide repeat protein [Mesorhizobium sp. Primo-B]